jgi:hypothetical protein
MYRTLITCLLFSLFAPLLHAQGDDLAVYRGTVRFKGDAQTAATFPKIVRSYLLVNYSTRESILILYYTKTTKKLSVNTVNYRMTRATLPNSKNATIFAAGEATSTSPDNFQHSCVLIRGNEVGLLIETNPSRRSIERPRTLTGTALAVLAFPSEPTALQVNALAFALDNAKTLAANNEDKSLTAVRDEIVAALEAQGYVDM